MGEISWGDGIGVDHPRGGHISSVAAHCAFEHVETQHCYAQIY